MNKDEYLRKNTRCVTCYICMLHIVSRITFYLKLGIFQVNVSHVFDPKVTNFKYEKTNSKQLLYKEIHIRKIYLSKKFFMYSVINSESFPEKI